VIYRKREARGWVGELGSINSEFANWTATIISILAAEDVIARRRIATIDSSSKEASAVLALALTGRQGTSPSDRLCRVVFK
jgi:hypothetical protein